LKTMLDLFLGTVYRHEAEKTASAALEAKLRTMPAEVVEKIAFGLGPKCDDSGGAKCWLDNFKGTPLFEKAVELERAEIQLEQADIEQRMNMQSQDSWTKRDALRLQKKMLELDLAMEGAGVSADIPPEVSAEVAPEVAEEAAIGTLEQVQAEEAAAGEGDKPEERQENAAIAQLQAAHDKPQAPQAPPSPPAAEGPPAPPKPEGAEAGGQPPFPPKAPPKPPAKKEPPKEGAPEEDEKQASLKVAAAAAAGRLLAKTAEPAPPKGMSVKAWDKELQKKAASNPEGHYLRRALLGNSESAAIEAKPEHAFQAKNQAEGYANQQGWKGLTHGGLAGGLLGAVGGAVAGSRAGASSLGTGLLGGAAGALGGATLGSLAGSVKGNLDSTASKLHGQYSQHRPEAAKTAGINVGGLVGAAKAAVPALTGAAKAGGSMVGTAMKAGGLPQVAKSVGNVATGFAKANPLVAAGAAGAAGLAAGRLSKGPSQPRM
jgi:hypothetical protein